MVKKTLEIHSENILPIIKKWLYSDRDIFIRELVSNACDAMQKMKILAEQGQAEVKEEELKVCISLDKENRTLTFSDSGVGMTEEEVQKYIAQIAFSGAEEFLQKYRKEDEKEPFIGHFGLGFYSAYMVAQSVEIDTLSYKPNEKPVFWSCDGSSEYEVKEGSQHTRGTKITLYISQDADEFLEEAKLKSVLKRYCSFVPFPVYFGEEHINQTDPLWIDSPSKCSDEDYRNFYRSLYPMEEDPLFWIHLNVDYPFHLQGILYFPKIRQDFDMKQSAVQLYCNRVFVSDDCKEVIPNYLTMLRGVIDSPDIPLNVSRSYLQMDRTVRQLSKHITKKVADSLLSLYNTERDRFVRCWEDISIVVKLGVMEDEKFYEKAKPFLVWKTSTGEMITIEEYLTRNEDKIKQKVLYTRDEDHVHHLLEMYRSKGIDVLCCQSPIDTYLIQFLERKLSGTQFQRIDSSVEEHILDESREKKVLDQQGKTEAGKLADLVRSKLTDQKVDIEAKSLATDTLPGFVMIDESQRRLRDYMMTLNPKNASQSQDMVEKRTFVVNTNHPLMTAIQEIDTRNPELAKELIVQIYQTALLSQREMDPKSLNDFISRNNHILEQLVKKLASQEPR